MFINVERTYYKSIETYRIQSHPRNQQKLNLDKGKADES